MQASSVCPSCLQSAPPGAEVCPHCGNRPERSAASSTPAWLAQIRPRVEREWTLASQVWPRIHLSLEAFLLKVSQIAKKQVPAEPSAPAPRAGENLEQFLQSLRWKELYLASACANGDEAAWEIFREQYQPAIRRTALRALGNAAEAEELAHTLLTDLFMPGRPGAAKGDNKIGQYHGMGSLEGWIKVVIHRLAIDRFRLQQRNLSLEELEVEPSSAAPADRSEHSVEQFETERASHMVSRSLARALDQLTTQEKLLLNLYYLQNVNLKEIGTWLHVHESTASRWLDRLKARLRKSMSKQLQQEFGVKKAEISYVMEQAKSQVEIDLKKILAE